MKRATIAVGLSGGVDSSVAAALLLEAGHSVIGLTMQIWDPRREVGAVSGRGGCYGPGEAEDLARARDVAARLGIAHHTVPLAADYEREVLEPFRQSYLRGLTPNPCALCNPLLKFDLLPRRAREAGLRFDWFATGHYARIQPPEADGRYRLRRGLDRAKDQSYFLARLSQQQLAATLFPLGEYDKTAIRVRAVALGFGDLAAQPESQDFFEGEDRGDLFEPGAARPGPIVDEDGRQVGTHRGLIYYTIGQREGLGLALGRRVYVKTIDAAANTLVVADHDAVLSTDCRVGDVRWIAGEPPAGSRPLTVQLRYRHPGVEATLTPAQDAWRVGFAQAQFAVTPGQMAVFYSGDEVLGGGWILP